MKLFEYLAKVNTRHFILQIPKSEMKTCSFS